MRILYVAMRYDYGRPEQGDSFEHCNFYHTLYSLGHEVLYFDVPTQLGLYGRDEMNRRLLEMVHAEEPDVLFSVLFEDEIDAATIHEISHNTSTSTVNWFCDDHWRFESFSRNYAPSFNWVVTTDSAAVSKYHAMGYDNVIKSQWACNHFLYKKLDVPLSYDVTFVGKPHGARKDVIAALQEAGARVHVWGNGWGHGRASQNEMIEIFNASRINLNLSNSSSGRPHRWERWLRQGRGRLGMRRYSHAARDKLLDAPGKEQIKGRNFEVPGCGGFLLTGKADNLGDYYDIGREIATYHSFESLVKTVEHFLDNEELRLKCARAGYERTIREHTYAHRFEEIFSTMGLTLKDDVVRETLGYDDQSALLTQKVA